MMQIFGYKLPVQLLRRQTVILLKYHCHYSCASCVDDDIIDLSNCQTVVCQSGVVACWHPEKSISYEHSKPINLKNAEAEKQNFGVLNKETKYIVDLRGSLARTGPPNAMLREIFYTGKHEWFTRPREERLRSVAAPDPKRESD